MRSMKIFMSQSFKLRPLLGENCRLPVAMPNKTGRSHVRPPLLFTEFTILPPRIWTVTQFTDFLLFSPI